MDLGIRRTALPDIDGFEGKQAVASQVEMTDPEFCKDFCRSSRNVGGNEKTVYICHVGEAFLQLVGGQPGEARLAVIHYTGFQPVRQLLYAQPNLEKRSSAFDSSNLQEGDAGQALLECGDGSLLKGLIIHC